MTTNVRFTPVAKSDLLRIADRWEENRPKAPALFVEELEAAIVTLATTPTVGARYESAGKPGLRRFLMRRTRFHLYYVHDPDEGLVSVVRVWSAVRGRRPPV